MAAKGWKPPFPPQADYQLKDKSKEYIMLDSATSDGYSGIFRNFTYKIPFACFESFGELLDSRCSLYEDYQECLDDRIKLGIGGNGARNRMHNRASIYGDNFAMFWDVPRKNL